MRLRLLILSKYVPHLGYGHNMVMMDVRGQQNLRLEALKRCKTQKVQYKK